MTFRRIDISNQTFVDSPVIVSKPKLDWIDLHKLMIDETYQRPLLARNWKVIQRIAAEFDWAMFVPVMAAPMHGGGFALIDGQHRAHAALMVGLDRVPAMIVDIVPQQQAAAFAAINSQRTAVSAFHIFRAALVSGEPWAGAAARACDDAGCRLMTSAASAMSKKPGQIYAIGLVRDHVQAGRAALITHALSAIQGSERQDDVRLYQSRILKPLLAVLSGEKPVPLKFLEQFINDVDLIKTRNTVGDLRSRPEYTRLSDYELAKRSFRALLFKSLRTGLEVEK